MFASDTKFESEKAFVVALNSRVLAVAIVNILAGDWSAYVGAVEGMSHKTEFQSVADTGSKLQYELAKIMFPTVATRYRWRN